MSRVVEPDADLGCAVEITPVRLVNDAVTFHLAWARTRDEGKDHRPIPFFFDSSTEGGLVLDIFGEVTVASGDRTSDVKIMTRSRIFDPNQPPGRPFPRETTATIRITPKEVVSVQLPQVADSPASPRERCH